MNMLSTTKHNTSKEAVMSDSKSTEETRGLVLEDILQKVFRAGIGFERGESMMENSHFKMTPQHALKEIETLVAKRVEEAFKAGVAMSGGELEFQEAFYQQWQLNLEHSALNNQTKENK